MKKNASGNISLYLRFKLKEKKEWITEDGLFPKIVNIMLEQDIVPLHYYSLEDDRLVPINQKEIIENYIITEEGQTRSLELYREQSDQPFDDGMEFSKSSLYGGEFVLCLFLNSFDTETNISKLQKFIWNTIDVMKNDCYLEGGEIQVMSPHIDYLEPRPMRNFGVFVKKAIINIFDHAYFEAFPDKLAGIKKYQVDELIQALETKDHPYQVEKREDRFTMVTWSDTLQIDQLSDILSKREDFFYENVSLPLDLYFNEEGDKKIMNIHDMDLLPEEYFFTYTHRNYKAAFKAYAGPSDTEVDEDSAEQLKKFDKSMELEDGRKINQILLIVTSRKLALSLEEHAKSLGVSKLLYVDNDKNLWDIYPKGNWKIKS
ncbi:hypothetical protein [Aureivirga sp. CE67]|uniref:hypothetical protein n=1 Tax=Aureivirga sp. CE67 TaxID=1788983 RepID=UPI0018CB11CB|nr:hypothetical protein [Aureivirga sp. CE67]